MSFELWEGPISFKLDFTIFISFKPILYLRFIAYSSVAVLKLNVLLV